MGRLIEQIALQRGHHIVATIDNNTPQPWPAEWLQTSDVAIEFTTPNAAPHNIKNCIQAHLPIVCGTTGWYDHLPQIKALCTQHQGTLFYASNFSVGVYLFNQLNIYLAKLMERFSAYDVSMEEIHHCHKLDYPSGTALTLAEGIMENLLRKKNIVTYLNNNPKPKTEDTDLAIHAVRTGEVPGTHRVDYTSEVDEIHLEHRAKGRDGFALGAVLAAEFLLQKKGIFTMQDLMQQH